MNQYKYDKADIKQRASGAWLSIISKLAPELEPAIKAYGKPKNHAPCPFHSGSTDGFHFFDDAPATGGGMCYSCGKWSDGIALLMKARGWSFAETLKQVDAAIAGGVIPYQGELPVQAKPEKRVTQGNGKAKAIKYLLDTSSRKPNRAAVAYYERRGIPDAAKLQIDSITYHDAANVYAGKPLLQNGKPVKYPCIIGKHTDATGTRGLTQIFLTPDGRNAAPEIREVIRRQNLDFQYPKKYPLPIEPGALSGSGIRFSKAGDVLGVTEGLENALAACLALDGNLSLAACGTASLLGSFNVPPQVKHLIIFTDKDLNNAGMVAAEKLRDRYADKIQVTITTPPMDIPDGSKSVDFLDYYAATNDALAFKRHFF